MKRDIVFTNLIEVDEPIVSTKSIQDGDYKFLNSKPSRSSITNFFREKNLEVLDVNGTNNMIVPSPYKSPKKKENTKVVLRWNKILNCYEKFLVYENGKEE